MSYLFPLLPSQSFRAFKIVAGLLTLIYVNPPKIIGDKDPHPFRIPQNNGVLYRHDKHRIKKAILDRLHEVRKGELEHAREWEIAIDEVIEKLIVDQRQMPFGRITLNGSLANNAFVTYVYTSPVSRERAESLIDQDGHLSAFNEGSCRRMPDTTSRNPEGNMYTSILHTFGFTWSGAERLLSKLCRNDYPPVSIFMWGSRAFVEGCPYYSNAEIQACLGLE